MNTYGSVNIRATFDKKHVRKKAVLIAYLVCGDPTHDSNVEACKKIFDAGVDILELGIPFSDPMADGDAIQLGHQRAIRHGVCSIEQVLQTVRNLRNAGYKQPIILMGYLNSIGNIGYHSVLQYCNDAGVDGLLVVDLPLEELKDFQQDCSKLGLANIQMVSPNTDRQRMHEIAKHCNGFVYYVSYRGVTGKSIIDYNEVVKNISDLRAMTDLPIAQGFGIKTAEHVSQAGEISDAVVVGSALVSLSHDVKAQVSLVEEFTRALEV